MLTMPDVKTAKKEKPQELTETAALEQRLEEILSKVKGAGEVEVMVVFKDNGRENLAVDTQYSQDADGKIKSEKTTVLGNGKEAVVVQKTIPTVQGVIVIAQGAYDSQVRENLKKAVEAALPVMSHRIEVLAGE